jgi:RES domain-containing protein
MAKRIALRPHAEADTLARSMGRCQPLEAPIRGVAFRASPVEFASRDDIVTGAGSRATGGRWNPRGCCHTVYLSLDIRLALDEYLGQFHRFGLRASAKTPVVIAAVEFRLRRVIDLTDGSVRRALAVSLARMTDDDWIAAQDDERESLTQAIGRIAFDHKLEGLKVPSAPEPAKPNLVLFPGNIVPPASWVRLINRDRLPEPS